MASIKLTCLLLLFGTVSQAQTFAEWFKQKSTQKKYLNQQIAALQVYSGYLKNGYQIAKGGLGTIGGYVGKEFDLHGQYYTHLENVSSHIKNDPQVAEILRWEKDVIDRTEKIKQVQGLNNAEKNYIVKVCAALLTDCAARLQDLQTIMQDQKTKMSDEERIRQLAQLHNTMQDNYRFSCAFLVHTQLYVRNKALNRKDINTLTRLYANY